MTSWRNIRHARDKGSTHAARNYTEAGAIPVGRRRRVMQSVLGNFAGGARIHGKIDETPSPAAAPILTRILQLELVLGV